MKHIDRQGIAAEMGLMLRRGRKSGVSCPAATSGPWPVRQ